MKSKYNVRQFCREAEVISQLRGAWEGYLVMTINQIESAGRKAGFIRQPFADRLRVIFRRGFNFLNVHLDGRWAFYANLPDGRKPDNSGTDFESLSVFLATRAGRV